MQPIKSTCKQYKDVRGHLSEITPKNKKKKFIYSIRLSRKNFTWNAF